MISELKINKCTFLSRTLEPLLYVYCDKIRLQFVDLWKYDAYYWTSKTNYVTGRILLHKIRLIALTQNVQRCSTKFWPKITFCWYACQWIYIDLFLSAQSNFMEITMPIIVFYKLVWICYWIQYIELSLKTLNIIEKIMHYFHHIIVFNNQNHVKRNIENIFF